MFGPILKLFKCMFEVPNNYFLAVSPGGLFFYTVFKDYGKLRFWLFFIYNFKCFFTDF